MVQLRPLLLIALFVSAVGHGEEDGTVRELKALTPERCLAQEPEEIATRCPNIAGRHLLVDGKPVALLDRLDRKNTFWCDKDGSSWRCRRIVVLGRDLRSARTRNPQAFVTASELLKSIAIAPTVKLGQEFGALSPPGEHPKTCVDTPGHGCAVEAVRLRSHAPDKNGTPMIRRRLWMVEDADGPMLACSDAELTRCELLTAAAWQALALTLRPSSLAPPEPPPELDVPDVRSDKRGPAVAVGGAGAAADTPAGALDPWLKQKPAAHLPQEPTRADVQKVQHALSLQAKSCLPVDRPTADVELVLSGEATLMGVLVEGEAPGSPLIACLTAAAKKVLLPRFDGAPYRLRTTVSPPVSARRRSRR
jgi:hypothetical protein